MPRVIYTTMYTSGIAGIQQTFDISSDIVVLLGLTTNLFGLAIGSVILSSLSEIYGRRLIYLVSVTLFALMILPVALAKNIEAVLISRFFGGFFGGAWIASAPGSVTDVTDDKYRALAISCWSLGTMNGPVLGMTPSNSKLSLLSDIRLLQRPYHWGLCLSIPRMALDKLACLDLFRGIFCFDVPS